MAVSSWMLRTRPSHLGKFDRRNREHDEDYVNIDMSKDVRLNCIEVLDGVCSANITEAKRLNYLNAFVKLILHVNGDLNRTGFDIEDLLCCLRVSLLHESTQVRAGGLRAIRHILASKTDIIVLNNLQLPYLIARSVDVVLRNDAERIQALKLIRKILLISADKFDEALVRCLVSLANGVGEDKDRMLRVCLAALCELGVLNSDLFIRCGGVAAITRNILECQMPRIVECLCGVLLHLLDKPVTRNCAGIDLHCLAAPYCDFHYRHAWLDKNRDERELRFNCSRLALLSVLRSWPGIMHFCSPSNTSGLQAIVDVLYLNQLEVRKAVLDLLYELLGLPQPEWTDEYSVALNAVDPSDPQDSWRLSEGFVVAEGRSIMPHLASTTPNIAEIHLATLLYVFLELGLLDALVDVIVTSDTFISVRATVLLGELLHMIHLLLPPECCNITPALPNLLTYSTTNSYQALAAVTALHQLHVLFKQRPASSSLYLDHILQSGKLLRNTSSTGERIKRQRSHSTKSKIYQLILKEGGEDALRESGVLQSKEGLSWNWSIIRAILKSDGDYMLKTDDYKYKAFLRRLVHYYQPSSNRYSHLDLTGPRQPHHLHTAVGCDLVHCLLLMPEMEGSRLLQEWFADILLHIDAITTSKSAHDCLFSPQHMSNTLCQTYFLFIGHMCHSRKGIAILQELGIFEKLMNLGTTTNHACYVKLIVSSFNYAIDGPHRQVLARILKCNQESSRLYATQFLLVLLRAGIPWFEQWGIELLVTQLFDHSKAVSLVALNILHEACENKIYLEKLVTLKPDLLHLGDKGLLLLIRFLSVPSGFELLNREHFVQNEITRWFEYFNYKYVRLMEAEILDSLTLHQRSEDGRYDRRHSSIRAGSNAVRRDVYVLPHLFGQLVQHARGRAALVQSNMLDSILRCACAARCDTEMEILKLKAAMWACGHLATSNKGVEMLVDNEASDDVFAAVLRIAEQCPVFSLRGTAVYVLGLMATTFKGASTLFSLGWACVRHNRNDKWPVIEEEDWSSDVSEVPSGYFDVSMRSRTESDRTSSDNTFWMDEMIPPSDEFLLLPDIDSTEDEPHIVSKKSSTLPYSSNSMSAQHKRSLSESKTIDTFKNHDNKINESSHNNNNISNVNVELSFPRRHRDNSCTESTTSGVSSCDSALGKLIINERIQTLSPIPSSSSLNTLKTSLELKRQNSDGLRRVSLSIQSSSTSNSLTVSPPDPSGSRLSHQDLMGYTALRSLRRMRLNSGRDEVLTRNVLSPSSVDSRRSNSLNRHLSEDDPLDNPLFWGSTSFPTTHKRYPIKDYSKDSGQSYMGVCLPRQFSKLFPNEQMAARKLSFLMYGRNTAQASFCDEEQPEEDGDVNGAVVTNKHKRLFKHISRTCLYCCRLHKLNSEMTVGSPNVNENNWNSLVGLHLVGDSNLETDTKVKLDILKHAERLSNPVWTKQSKQALLHLKQRHSACFQDICLYSEICSMISTIVYRLSTRRFLQELFLDLKCDNLVALTSELRKQKLQLYKSSESGIEAEVETVDSEIKVNNRANGDLAQRCAELAQVVRSHRTSNPVMASDTNRNVTRGFSVMQRLDSSEIRATSPLTSVLEEDVDRPVPKIQRNTLDTLKLTYNENKFPIKNRPEIRRTYSYELRSYKRVPKQLTTSQSVDQPSLISNHALTYSHGSKSVTEQLDKTQNVDDQSTSFSNSTFAPNVNET